MGRWPASGRHHKVCKTCAENSGSRRKPLRAPKLEKQVQTFDFKACNGILTVMRACIPKNACTRRLAYPFNLLFRSSHMNLCVFKLCASDGTQAAFPHESPPQSSIGVLYSGGSMEWRHVMRAGDLEVQSSMFANSLSVVKFPGACAWFA